MSDLKQWHGAVCNRDSYVCVVCGHDYSAPVYFDENGTNQYVCGHHLKTRAAHPELKFNVSNGICVCKECHTKIHKGLIDTKDFEKALKKSHENIDTVVKKSSKTKKGTLKNFPEVRYHTFPSGMTIALSHDEEICKCGKYIATKGGLCMACEKRGPSLLKEEKKKRKKKK